VATTAKRGNQNEDIGCVAGRYAMEQIGLRYTFGIPDATTKS
jgi:hypothetical protein